MLRPIAALALALGAAMCGSAQQKTSYDIFSYSAPQGFELKGDSKRVFLEKVDGKAYCQLYLWPAMAGQSDVEKDFARDWEAFATKAYQIAAPQSKDRKSAAGWDVVLGGARGAYNGINFVMSVATYTQKDITFAVVAVLNDPKFLPATQEFMGSVLPDASKFQRPAAPGGTTTPPVTAGSPPVQAGPGWRIAKPRTNFDDGWMAEPLPDHVRVTKGSTEVRLHYVDKALDDAKSNMVDVPEYYWSKYVAPTLQVSGPRKWSGVQYPIVYFMEGTATDKRTGKRCYVALKVVFEGGARPMVVVAPDQHTYQQMYPHPNDVNRMLSYNKFAITSADVTGSWATSGGAAMNYVNVYSGEYAGMRAISTSDEFTFHANGAYQSTHNSANTSLSGTTRFAGLKYDGRFTASDWELVATNRVEGKTKRFLAQFIAVKGGFLLHLTDSDYTPLTYTMFRK